MNPTEHPVIDTIRRRCSSRRFDPLRPIKDEDLLTIYEAGRWAPSSYGEEPWRFLICNRHKDYESWNKLLKSMTPFNQSWADTAPVFILCTTCLQFNTDKSRNRHAEYDLGAAVLSMVLQATALGLASRQIGGFDAHKLRNTFNIPTPYALLAILALGHNGNPSHSHPESIEPGQDSSCRKRIALSTLFFEGKWHKGIKL